MSTHYYRRVIRRQKTGWNDIPGWIKNPSCKYPPHCSPHPPCANNSSNDIWRLSLHHHWDEETEVQRHQVNCPRSHSQEGSTCWYSSKHLLSTYHVPGKSQEKTHPNNAGFTQGNKVISTSQQTSHRAKSCGSSDCQVHPPIILACPSPLSGTLPKETSWQGLGEESGAIAKPRGGPGSNGPLIRAFSASGTQRT